MDVYTLQNIANSSPEDRPLQVDSTHVKNVSDPATLREKNVFKTIVHTAINLQTLQQKGQTLAGLKLIAENFHVSYMSTQQLAGAEAAPKPFSGKGILLWKDLQKQGQSLQESDPGLLQLQDFLLNHMKAYYGPTNGPNPSSQHAELPSAEGQGSSTEHIDGNQTIHHF